MYNAGPTVTIAYRTCTNQQYSQRTNRAKDLVSRKLIHGAMLVFVNRLCHPYQDDGALSMTLFSHPPEVIMNVSKRPIASTTSAMMRIGAKEVLFLLRDSSSSRGTTRPIVGRFAAT